jgi:hypothetical protein
VEETVVLAAIWVGPMVAVIVHALLLAKGQRRVE